MTTRKPDAAAILARLAELRGAMWLGAARRWWPSYLFHFTDVRNAVSILLQRRLLSRSRCPSVVDSASAKVIERTAEKWKDHVRLYFRPRTPTQFHNEGIQPTGASTSLSAHCPVPVFLIFDADDLLTRESACFSEGNLAAERCTVGEDAAFFASIPFEKVYHDSCLRDDEKRSIVFHRHAEVLFPEELDLSALKHVVCRSEAEAETLRNLLQGDALEEFGNRIRFGRHRNLFLRRWTFVESVLAEQRLVTFGFNQNTVASGPFLARAEARDLGSGDMRHWQDHAYQALSELRLRIPQFTHPTP
ncbi:MAG: DarT ssDNA thymidine ADP-ribosyltransferase family protein [Planctomycetales bacterium]